MMRWVYLVTFVGAFLGGVAAQAASGTVESNPNSGGNFALGARFSGWAGPYDAPGVGGHLKIRPWDMLGIELFNDNFAVLSDDGLRHDHVIGFSLYAPRLLSGEDWFLAPTFGSCVDFSFSHPKSKAAPGTSDLLFGVHGGLMAEVFVFDGFAFEMNATVYGYLGHEAKTQGWSARVSNRLGGTAVAQLNAGLNYWF